MVGGLGGCVRESGGCVGVLLTCCMCDRGLSDTSR